MARAGHVVHQHHLAPGHGQGGQLDLHLVVPVPGLAAHRVVPAKALRRAGHPLQRFFVGADQHRPHPVARDVVGQQRRAAEHDGVANRHGLAQHGHAVQVRVHGDDRVEQAGEETADHALADHLAGVEGDVLAHVGQVGRHQREVTRAELARRLRGQQQLHQFFIGLVQAAPEHHARRQRFGQAQAQLAVGKAVARDQGQLQPGRVGGAGRDDALVFKTQQAAGQIVQGYAHQNSTNTWGSCPALPML